MRASKFLLLFLIFSAKAAALKSQQLSSHAGVNRRHMLQLPTAAATSFLSSPSLSVLAAETSVSAKHWNSIGVLWETIRNRAIPATPACFGKILNSEILGNFRNLAETTGIICVSERHDDFEHHIVQLRVIQSVRKAFEERLNKSSERSNKSSECLAIGMECFQRKHQKYLDKFISSSSGESLRKLKIDTNWDNTWGYDILHYAPILLFAQKHNIRILGLHPSNDLVEKVREKGLSAIPRSIIDGVSTSDLGHYKRFRSTTLSELDETVFGCKEAMEAHLRKIYEVQCFREEYMAETVARHQRETKGCAWIITLAGERHILHRDGIPFRALRRDTAKRPGIQNRGIFTIVPRTVNFPVILHEAPGIGSADYVWFVERDPSIVFDETSINVAPRQIRPS